MDRPDGKLELKKQYYQKYLPENAGPGLPVVQVEVKEPEDKSAVIRFRLEGEAKKYFAINESTGMIKTEGEPLDWETTPVITFPVFTYEKQSPNITGKIFVRVIVSITSYLYFSEVSISA